LSILLSSSFCRGGFFAITLPHGRLRSLFLFGDISQLAIYCFCFYPGWIKNA
jgi:hypothetical protein